MVAPKSAKKRGRASLENGTPETNGKEEKLTNGSPAKANTNGTATNGNGKHESDNDDDDDVVVKKPTSKKAKTSLNTSNTAPNVSSANYLLKKIF